MRVTFNPLILGGYPAKLWVSAKRIRQIAETHRISLIHVQHPVGAMYSIWAARQLNVPLILHIHEGLPAKWLYRVALNYAAKRATRIICVSEAAKELVRAADVNLSNVRVIYSGIPDEMFDGLDEPASEVTGDGPHIGVFGAIEPRKAQHVLLEAAELLAPRFPTAHFWLVGARVLEDKTAYLRKLEMLSRRPALSGRVTFVGFQQHVARWMRAMDLVVLPSVAYELFGLVLAEAMALGCPVVASRTGGTPEIVTDRVTGRLVDPGNPEALALAIAEVLESDTRETCRRGVEDIRRRFSAERFCRQIGDLYKEVGAASDYSR